MSNSFEWIDTPAGLARCREALVDAPAIGIDTEFERVRTYYAKLALVQLATHDRVYLIDPLALEDLSPLWDLVASQSPVKVFHSAGEDLELIDRLAGQPPDPLFDTQVAAALLGADLSTGYQRLLAEELGVEIDKGASRSNWMKRPLSQRQLTYAVEDVAHLLVLHERFAQRLADSGRQGWFNEEMDALRAPARLAPPPQDLYLKFSGAWNCNRRQLAVLRDLLAWRERQAQQADVPKGWMLADDAVRDIAFNPPASLDQLAAIDGIKGGTVRRRGKRILGVIEQAMDQPEEQWPEALTPPPRGPEYKQLIQDLKRALGAVARDQGLRPELLASKRDLLNVVAAARNGQKVGDVIQGWRRPLIESPLSDVLDQHQALL